MEKQKTFTKYQKILNEFMKLSKKSIKNVMKKYNDNK